MQICAYWTRMFRMKKPPWTHRELALPHSFYVSSSPPTPLTPPPEALSTPFAKSKTLQLYSLVSLRHVVIFKELFWSNSGVSLVLLIVLEPSLRCHQGAPEMSQGLRTPFDLPEDVSSQHTHCQAQNHNNPSTRGFDASGLPGHLHSLSQIYTQTQDMHITSIQQ